MPELRKGEQMEESIRMSGESCLSLTNDILNTSMLGILILDSDFRVVWMNQTLEQYLGLRRDEVVGKDMRHLIHERIKDAFEESETFAEKMLATYDSDTYIENLECHVRPDGEREERWLKHWSQPIRSGPYTIGGRIEYYVDITEHKREEEALRASRNRFETIFDTITNSLYNVEFTVDHRSLMPTLIDAIKKLINIETHTGEVEEARRIDAELNVHTSHLKELVGERLEELLKAERSAALGEAAAMVAHDLRNPLQDIHLAQYLLRKRHPDEQKLLDQIDRCVTYADEIVENLLSYSGKRQLVLQETDINQLLSNSIEESVIPKNIRLEERLDVLLRVYADQTQMKRVFKNLILNAVQAMENGGTLTVKSKQVEGTLVISFQDTGVGIPETKLGLIWRPFYSSKAKGMGLGLSNVKQIVEGHGGTINVKSELGKGSTFIIQIPVQARNEKKGE